MAEHHEAGRGSRQAAGRRAERAARILDAAATLILRWGYNKTTVDDIARHAGVAKGTVYLHWKTREALFVALMQRERLALAADVQQRLRCDPEGATLHGLLRHSALSLLQRPLMKAVLLRDLDVVGKLAQTELRSAMQERALAFRTYLEVLRDHGLARTDLDLQEQVFVASAIFTGFLLVAPLMPEEFRPTDDRLAALIAEAIRRVFAPPGGASNPGVGTQAATDYLAREMAIAQDRLRRSAAS